MKIWLLRLFEVKYWFIINCICSDDEIGEEVKLYSFWVMDGGFVF